MSSARNTLSDQELVDVIDGMMGAHYVPTQPGASIIVTRGGAPLFRKGYGLANVELGVPIEPHMVFRLGSITKQFTAVCILKLCEQGKLGLDDEITRFLPDYPTHGHRITVKHLLTHTSGIKSYTDTSGFGGRARTDLTLRELVDSFKPLPMDFAPGTDYRYSNSGYVLLGAIIEQASGMSYPEFLKAGILEPLALHNTCFELPNVLIPGRVAGYKPVGEGYANADYLSMTLPHAGGSIASNVDDMAAWDAALYTERLVKQEWLRKAWTPCTLPNGISTGYGYGWQVGTFQDHHIVMHAGGINGFNSDAIRFPRDRVYVCILSNRGAGIPDNLAFRIGAAATGKPYEEPVAIPFDPTLYARYEGVYQGKAPNIDVSISREGDKLTAALPGGPKQELVPVSRTEFAWKGPIWRAVFELDGSGTAVGLTLYRFFLPGWRAVKAEQQSSSQRPQT